MGSARRRSAPVWRSRRKSAVRGPNRCPLNEIVPPGNAAREGEPASVGGRLGRDRAAARPLVLLLGLPLGHVVDLAGLEVEFPDLHGAPDHVALGGRREVEIEGSVARRGRPARPPVLGAVHQFHSASAIGVEEVEARPAGPGEGVPAGHDPLPVREPGRRGDPRFGVLVDRPRVAAVRVHEPEVRLSAPVGDEGDGRAVGRPARVVVDRHPAVLGQAFRASAGDRHLVNVAEQVEDDGVPVRRDVEGHEGPLGGLEDEVVGVAPGERGVPARIVGAAASLGGGGARNQQRGGDCEETEPGARRKGRRDRIRRQMHLGIREGIRLGIPHGGPPPEAARSGTGNRIA